MTRPIRRLFGDYRARARWAEWAPFIVVLVVAAGILVAAALSSPVLRPLPVPGGHQSTTSPFQRVVQLVGGVLDSTVGAMPETGALPRTPKDSD